MPVASKDNEPHTEEAEHQEGGEEGDEEAGDQGALHMGHITWSAVRLLVTWSMRQRLV